MKLVVVIIGTSDLDELLRLLNARGYRATVIDQSGGFLRRGNVTLLIGVQEALVGDLLRLITEICRSKVSLLNAALPMVEPAEVHISHPIEAVEGGAVYFVLNIQRYERIA